MSCVGFVTLPGLPWSVQNYVNSAVKCSLSQTHTLPLDVVSCLHVVGEEGKGRTSPSTVYPRVAIYYEFRLGFFRGRERLTSAELYVSRSFGWLHLG